MELCYVYYAYYITSVSLCMSTLAYALGTRILRYKCGAYIIFEDSVGTQTGGRKDGQTEGEVLSNPHVLLCFAI